MTDLTYIRDGLFTRFMPETKAGEDAWRIMAKADGVAAVLTIHEQSVFKQLRAAGYKIAKAKPVKLSDDDLLNELLN